MNFYEVGNWYPPFDYFWSHIYEIHIFFTFENSTLHCVVVYLQDICVVGLEENRTSGLLSKIIKLSQQRDVGKIGIEFLHFFAVNRTIQ